MQSEIYFVADIHLERNENTKRDLFLSFVKMVKDRGGDLYILGDLFDYWANNRRIMKDNSAVLEALADLASQSSKVAFLIGNRDLLLGEKVLSHYGIDYMDEQTVKTINGKRVLLTHGHLLCTNDVAFQKYRRTQWPIYRVLDTILPGFIENALAKLFIQRSKQVIESQESWRLQFPEEVIKETFESGVEMIICGHSHKPMVKRYEGERYFVVLSNWTSSTGGYLRMSNGEFQLKDFSNAS
jgi:UDP-2,3-diacylglucosamine hydrolase